MLSNTDGAELLARQAERESGILSRAFRRAARSAFLWPEEIAHVAAENRSLTELRAIGPFIEISIRTDAHHPWQLDFTELGLAATPPFSTTNRQFHDHSGFETLDTTHTGSKLADTVKFHLMLGTTQQRASDYFL